MSKRKSPEVKLTEAIKELGLVKAASIFKVLESYNTDTPTRVRKPKLAKAETA
jgi:hypothetical protein